MMGDFILASHHGGTRIVLNDGIEISDLKMSARRDGIREEELGAVIGSFSSILHHPEFHGHLRSVVASLV
jgi:cytochrome P450